MDPAARLECSFPKSCALMVYLAVNCNISHRGTEIRFTAMLALLTGPYCLVANDANIWIVMREGLKHASDVSFEALSPYWTNLSEVHWRLLYGSCRQH